MKIVFMGTPDLSEFILNELINSDNEILAVVTKPDKPKGRGNEMTCSPVKLLAQKHNIPVLQPDKAKSPEFLDELKVYDPELIVVAAYGKILPKEILDMPRYGCINVHTSLLPKYRGAAPIQWAIINGDAITGVTIQHMAEGIDTGDIIKTCEVEVAEDETAGTLYDKLAQAGAQLLLEAIKEIKAGTSVRIPQDNSAASYVTTIDKEFGHLDFSEKAVDIERKIRGLNPWPSAYCYMNGKTLKLWKAEVEQNDIYGSAENGTIVKVMKDCLVIKTGDELLKVVELQLEGKKRMPAEDFLRGFKIEEGIVLN